MSDPIARAMARNHSFWQHKYGCYQPNEPLGEGEHTVDVLVIGAGYTGLTAAREIRREAPEKRVMVLDAHEVGYGASGRNGGFNMTLFGIEPEVTVLRWGKNKAREAQAYMQQAVTYVRELIERERLDSDYENTGLWRVAYTRQQEKRLRKTYELLSELTMPGRYTFLDHATVQAKLNAPNIRAAIFEPDTGILDPCKHVRNLKTLAEKGGAEIYENTTVTHLSKQPDLIVAKTANATIKANKLILATNAWSHTLTGLPKVKHRQTPVWTYQIVSDPLTEEEWETLGWQDRMSIEDNRQFVHYLRITKCGRITLGGGNVGVEYGKSMDQWHAPTIWKDLEDHFRWLFPSLGNKKIHYKWGGAISANLDLVPEIGFIGDENIIYSTGCIGHGVSLTQLNGRLLADLVLEKDTELSKFWIVKRHAIPLPPGDLLPYLGVKAIVGVLKGIDRYEERELHRDKN